jgi:HEAT repeat protein
MPTARLVRRDLRALASTDDAARWEAAKRLAGRGGWRLRVELERIARHHRSPNARGAAAWTLGFRGDPRAAATLVSVLADDGENSRVRGHAAEALGHLLQFRPRDERVEQAVISGLEDASADVRFWSAFAAATIPVQAAAPKLQALAAEDKAEVDGWWAVGTEAGWALRTLEGDPHADDLLPTVERAT